MQTITCNVGYGVGGPLGASAAMFAGFTAVIETVIPDRAQLEGLIAALALAPMLVVLSPGIATCRARNATRDDSQQWEFAGYEQLAARMASGFGGLRSCCGERRLG